MGGCDSRLEDLGLDSLAMVDLRNQLNSSTGHFVETEILLANPSLGEIIADLVRQEAATSATDQDMSKPTEKPNASSNNGLLSIFDSYANIYLSDDKVDQNIIFILSTPRAGSSLLQLCMQAHSEFYAPQELYLLPFSTMEERADALPPRSGLREGLVHAVAELLGCSFDAATSTVESWIRLTTVDVYKHLQDMCDPRTLVDKTPMNAMRPCQPTCLDLPRLA